MYMWTNWSTKLAQHVLNYDQEKVEARWAKRHKRGGKQVFDMIIKASGNRLGEGRWYMRACAHMLRCDAVSRGHLGHSSVRQALSQAC